jgi:hypothetical protein
MRSPWPQWWAWVGIALCVVALAFGLTVRQLELPPGASGITEENAKRIRPGMGLDEVEVLLGGRPSFLLQDGGSGEATWQGPGLVLWVTYGTHREGVLTSSLHRLPPQSPLGRLRSLLSR